MSDWRPLNLDADPTVNALLNIARSLHEQVDATLSLVEAVNDMQHRLADVASEASDEIAEAAKLLAIEIPEAAKLVAIEIPAPQDIANAIGNR